MTDRKQHAPGPARGAQFRRFWSAYVEALDRYLDRIARLTLTKSNTSKRPQNSNHEQEKGKKK
jgi:hypothetical protein